MTNALISLTNLLLGLALGWGYAQLFSWRPSRAPAWLAKLITPGSLTVMRLLLVASVIYLLLSYTEIQPIIVSIMFISAFWYRILRQNRML